jgi:hypothetical protein
MARGTPGMAMPKKVQKKAMKQRAMINKRKFRNKGDSSDSDWDDVSVHSVEEDAVIEEVEK